MKIAGWILLVIGLLSFLGTLVGGSNPTGPLFCIGLGAYLISRTNMNKKEGEEKDKWSNSK